MNPIVDDYGCPACWPDDAGAAWNARAALVHDLTLVDESHFIVAIRRCGACHQRFISVFAETIDWTDGEDPQYRQLMPVNNDEIVLLAAAGAGVESVFAKIGPDRRALHRDFPKSGDIVCGWHRGLLTPPHD
jgi:hypothetical protein